MVLKGQAKKDYQRAYMFNLRLMSRMLDPSVRPSGHDDSGNPMYYGYGEVYVEVDADGNPIYEE